MVPTSPAHRLPDPLVGLVAVEALNVDLSGRGLLVPHRVGDLARGQPLRGEPRTVGVSQVVERDTLDARVGRGGVEAATLHVPV